MSRSIDSRFVGGIVVPSTPTLISLYNMCQDISLKSCVCSPWPAPRVACPDWKGITTRLSSVRSLRGTRSWPAYTSDTTSSLATNWTSQVLPTGIPAEWGFVFRDSWISWLWTATPPSHAPVSTGWLSWEAKADAWSLQTSTSGTAAGSGITSPHRPHSPPR